MVVKPYQEGDVTQVRIRLGDDWGGFSEITVASGPGMTFWDNSGPVAVMGIIPMYTGVGGVWCVISDDVRGHGKSLTRWCSRMLGHYMEMLTLHRVQAFVKVERPEYVRWAQLLGFEIEGIMRKGTPEKRDMYLMARVI